jgi:hypothetical protein
MIGRKGGTKVYDFKYNVLMKCLTAYKRSADDNSGSIILNVNIFFEFFLYVLLTNIIVFRNANYSFTSAPDVGPKYTEIEEARNSVCVCVHVNLVYNYYFD